MCNSFASHIVNMILSMKPDGKSSGISMSVESAGHSFSGTHLFKSGKCGSELSSEKPAFG